MFRQEQLHVYFYKNTLSPFRHFLSSVWMFLNNLLNQALNVCYVFLKILEISYSNEATVRREIELLVKNVCGTDIVCTLYPV